MGFTASVATQHEQSKQVGPKITSRISEILVKATILSIGPNTPIGSDEAIGLKQ